MTDKLKTSKSLLEQAFRALPYNNSLREVRTHIQKALTEINKQQTKAVKRDKIVQEQQPNAWAFDVQSGELVNPFTLKYLDKLIQEQQKKLTELETKVAKKANPEPTTPDTTEESNFLTD